MTNPAAGPWSEEASGEPPVVARPADARPRRILLVAGEASGDLHGADLVAALRERVPRLDIVGVGGERLRAMGMRTIADAGDVATVGVVEAVGRLGTLARTYRQLAAMLRRDRPDLAIFIDFPEFNLRLARIAKRAGVPVFYYIGPQVWAWRRGRVRTIARRVDALALVFPFELPLYHPRCPVAEFVGHPLLDRVRATRGRAESLRRYKLDPGRATIALLPGSRRKEIRYVLPRLLDAAEILVRDRDCQFVLALAPTVRRGDVEAELGSRDLDVRVIADDTYNVLEAADLVLVTSGTATLETALLERPMIIVYRLATLSYGLARLLVGVSHIGIPNIVAGRQIVPEFVQGAVTGQRIAAAAREIMDDRKAQQQMVRELAAMRTMLGPGGAAGRAAEIAAGLLRA
jgi:lipid-A-disaccharide synthase